VWLNIIIIKYLKINFFILFYIYIDIKKGTLWMILN